MRTWILLVTLVWVAGMGVFSHLQLHTQPAFLVKALVLAAIPLPVYLLLILWVDRYEPEPPSLLLFSLGWGISVSALLSIFLNDQAVRWMASLTQDFAVADFLGLMLGAPVVEESSKALILFGLFYWRRKDFDGVVDGFVYASMVGLGFALSENVFYYSRAAVQEQEHQLFLLRGLVSGFSHPLFTAMTGIGLGWACENPRHPLRWLAPGAGFLLAIASHSAWNSSLVLGLMQWVVTYLLVMIPSLVMALSLVVAALQREGSALRKHLKGVVFGSELEQVASIPGRLLFQWNSLQRRGPGGWFLAGAYLQDCTRLAFQRRRVELEMTPFDPELDRALQIAVQERKASLEQAWTRPCQ